MIKLTRRDLLTATAGVAAVSAVPAFAPPAHAAAPMAGKQAPGWYRYKVGSFEVTVATDGSRPTKVPDNFIRNAARDAWGPGLAAIGMTRRIPPSRSRRSS